MTWRPYAARPESTVTGTLLEWEGVEDANHAPRTLLAWLPPSYEREPERRYPVVYFHDGQNVFDAATNPFGSEWEADETLTRVAARGVEAIAIGIPHGGERRFHEYSTSPNPQFPEEGGGGADAYLAFLTKTVKPLMDGSLRTLPDVEHTTLIGSSMGGLISLYALLTRPDVFGSAGVMSPAFWACPGDAERLVRVSPPPTGRVWLDVGGRESTERPERSRAYWDDAHAMRDLLLEKGMGERLHFVADPEGEHHERAWAGRLPGALEFLLGVS
ncbi:alpha/beta hydrolase-fold protein [Deinococcus sp. YIM 134068]|uniref:alpha/beta hydrolase n=1 Tax=Deinococcus lichenicola TaxID=3118910 RepID=UPI002F953422